jgi:hypothetical protein
MWTRLALLIWLLALSVVALVFRVWGGAVAALLLALTLLPQVVTSLRATMTGQPLPEPRLYLPLRLSRPQQFATGMIVLGIPLTIWRVLEDGVVALAILGPLAALGVVWLTILIRREGWSGKKAARD